MATPRETRRAALGVSFTVGLYGLAFGAAGIAAGFSVLQTCLFSLLTFTGASQFAAVGVVAAGGAVVSAVSTATLVGTRNALYGLQMNPVIAPQGWRRFVAAHLTIDESTSVALAATPLGAEAMRGGFWWTGIGVYVWWNLFTLVGAVGAHLLGNPASWGLDAAVPAAFLGLLWPRLTTSFLRGVAVASMLVAMSLTPLLPAGAATMATALVAVAAGWRAR
jgi:predicted branched-subunit amino acid permease